MPQPLRTKPAIASNPPNITTCSASACKPAGPDCASERAGRRLAWTAFSLYLCFILLASAYPFEPSFDRAFLTRNLHRFAHSLVRYDIDTIAGMFSHLFLNVAMYIPLGLALALALGPDGGEGRRGTIARFAPLFGFVLSLLVEISQIALGGRDPDLGDTAMNTLGYLCGYYAAVWTFKRFRVDSGILLGRHDGASRENAALALGVLYGVLFLMLNLATFEPHLLDNLVVAKVNGDSWQAGHIWLNPLAPWTGSRLVGVVVFGLAFIPIGFLARIAVSNWNGRRLILLLCAAAGCAALIEACRIPMVGRASDAAQIPAAVLGMLAGIGLARFDPRKKAQEIISHRDTETQL